MWPLNRYLNLSQTFCTHKSLIDIALQAELNSKSTMLLSYHKAALNSTRHKRLASSKLSTTGNLRATATGQIRAVTSGLSNVI